MTKHLFALALAVTALAADPSGFKQWKGVQLKSYEKALAPKMNEHKMASEQLGRFGNHLFMVAHREGPGEAELHKTQDDVFIVQTGNATLIVGGTVVDGKETQPNEVRGPSIQGGEKKMLGPGDVLNIPANIPHQLIVEGGKQFTYMVVKVDTK